MTGFHKLSRDEKIKKIKALSGLDESDMKSLEGPLDASVAEMMSENVIGTVKLPFGIAVNFVINGRKYLIPMCIEEPSVVAAASNAAKLALPCGFRAECSQPVMIGQVQLVGISDTNKARESILSGISTIKKLANGRDSVMVKLGGGLEDVEVRLIGSSRGPMVVVHLIVNVVDAMGANCVNSMCEAVAPYLEEVTGGRAVLKIISNLADRRLAAAAAVWKKDVIGEDVIEGILDAYELARVDAYRCATNNKGIMNGVDAVAIATGNDFRALEAGAHAYAAIGRYRPLAEYEKNSEGDLVGRLKMPLAVGIVGGATKTNPVARTSLKILGVKSASELACVMACVGLANNFAALRAIVSEGIQRGHMKLHAKNIAMSAGASHEEAVSVSTKMIEDKKISVSHAKKILEEMRK
ncbi:MAG: hydroxymethylglutaryl-CoA reductase, degradative [Candidatus Aenigmarchaeota archaeon]|nr:hydroxymethylglutaryl-CoA reductase, degradative [Candidatus Aenigmarchaeota archaeon]